MNNKFKIVFIGGLSNGKIVFDYLKSNKYVSLELIITYPNDSYKPRHINFPDESNILKTDYANNYLDVIGKVEPDLIIVSGWSELLKSDLINLPKFGTIGFHPSKLPFDRGRSVLAWQIEEGYIETALSMFYYNQLPDAGDIIAQENIKIDISDSINDVLNKMDIATLNLMKAYFPLIRQNIAPRRPQNINEGNFRRLRTDIDSMINWNRPSIEIYNKIRAITHPYPGALGIIDGNKYRIWESLIINNFIFGNNETSGKLIAKLYDNSLIVKTRDSFIRVTDYYLEN